MTDRSEPPRVPYTMFGKTRLVPLRVFQAGERVSDVRPEWDGTLWIERGENWYGLACVDPLRRILVVEREDWLRAPEAPPEEEKEEKEEKEERTVEPEPCPMGCGELTYDAAGGPCERCRKSAPAPGGWW